MSENLTITLVIVLSLITVAFAQENATTTTTQQSTTTSTSTTTTTQATTAETTISSTIQSTIPSTTIPTTTTISSNKGACVIRDSYTNMPSLFDPDVGKGYAKKIKEGINTIDGLKIACSKADYDELLQKYCAQNPNSVQQEVVVYGPGGGWETTSCGAFGCSAYYCASLGTTTTLQTAATTIYACPLASMPLCESGYYVKSYTDQYNCMQYKCEPKTQTTYSSDACPTYYLPECGTNDKTYSNECFAKKDGIGIAYHGECGFCGNGRCEQNENSDNCMVDCETRPYCGNKRCDIGEDYRNCGQDCPYEQGPVACPFSLTCKDGSTVACRTLPDRSCFCDQCPVVIPLGCRQVTGPG